MAEIPFVPDSEIGSKERVEQVAILTKILKKGRAVPRDWLLAELGGIKPESLPSKLKRLGFKSKTREHMDGGKVVFILERPAEDDSDEET